MAVFLSHQTDGLAGNRFSLRTWRPLLSHLPASRNEKSSVIWTSAALCTLTRSLGKLAGCPLSLGSLKLHGGVRGSIHPLRGLSGPFRASDLGNWLESSLPFCFLCCFFLESLSCGCRTFSIHLIFLFPPPPSFYIFLSFRSSFWEIFPSFILQLFYCIFRFFR